MPRPSVIENATISATAAVRRHPADLASSRTNLSAARFIDVRSEQYAARYAVHAEAGAARGGLSNRSNRTLLASAALPSLRSSGVGLGSANTEGVVPILRSRSMALPSRSITMAKDQAPEKAGGQFRRQAASPGRRK